MRDFFGELHCACLSFDLLLQPVTTPDARMEISGHRVRCVGCSASFHDAEDLRDASELRDRDERAAVRGGG